MRTVSDILLDLEAKIDNLIANQKAKDLELKILSNKISLLLNDKNKSKQPELQQSKPSNPFVAVAGDDPPIVQQKNPYTPDKLEDKSVEQKQVEIEFVELAKATEVKEDIKEDLSSVFKISQTVPVSQIILLPNGKPAFLCNVFVKQNDDVLIKTRTTAAGKWNGALKPGNYIVKLARMGGMGGMESPIDCEYEIQIPQQSELFKLPNFKVK